MNDEILDNILYMFNDVKKKKIFFFIFISYMWVEEFVFISYIV